jgi:hypothetical protein
VAWVAGTLGETVVVVHLDVRRRIASLPAPGADPAAAVLRRGAPAQWWLPVRESVRVFETARWTEVDRHDLRAPVRALQSHGDAVWALVGELQAPQLLVWRGSGWQRVAVPSRQLRAMAAEARGERLLVGGADPSALHVLDAQGRVQRSWALPPEAGLRGVAWFPAA